MATLLYVDVQNIYQAIGRKFDARLDYQRFLEYLEKRLGMPFAVKHAYGSQKPRDARGFISLLKFLGFTVRFEENTDWNIPITLSAMKLSVITDTVVLASNSKALAPLIVELQSKGVRTLMVGANIHPTLKRLTDCYEVDESLLIREFQLEAVNTAK